MEFKKRVQRIRRTQVREPASFILYPIICLLADRMIIPMSPVLDGQVQQVAPPKILLVQRQLPRQRQTACYGHICARQLRNLLDDFASVAESSIAASKDDDLLIVCVRREVTNL